MKCLICYFYKLHSRLTGHFYSKTKKNKKKSNFRGVFWHAERKKWRAQANINKKQIHLGLFTNKKDAYKEYRRWKELENISKKSKI